MLLEPSVIVLYVENIEVTSLFYQELLGIKPQEASSTFYSFKLSNGMNLALKARHTVLPACAHENGSGELAFTLANNTQVDELFAEWQTKVLPVISPPAVVSYGYTFVALDPDGNLLRFVSLELNS